MIFKDFEVLQDDGITLIETLPAILYADGNNIVAQVPSGTTSVTFTALYNGQTTTVTATNGKAVFSPTANDTYRVGNPTISKHNEITITGIKSLAEVKQKKILELEQAYASSFTTFQSSALGVLKTYPANAEAQDNLLSLQQRLIADSTKNSFYFKTIEDGTLVNHTRAQFLQLMNDAEMFKVNQTIHFNSKVASVNSAIDIPTVQAITW